MATALLLVIHGLIGRSVGRSVGRSFFLWDSFDGSMGGEQCIPISGRDKQRHERIVYFAKRKMGFEMWWIFFSRNHGSPMEERSGGILNLLAPPKSISHSTVGELPTAGCGWAPISAFPLDREKNAFGKNKQQQQQQQNY
jgi:hypothetical protein